jgi:Tol biopolymer transport system component
MSSVDWTPELAAALDRLVPLEDGSRADWGDVVGRARPRRRLQSWRPLRGLRLAIVIAVIFLLLAGVATATYLLVRGNGGIALGGGRQLVVVNPNEPGLQHVVARCSVGSCEIGEPAFSPDGKRLAFIRGFNGGPYGQSWMSVFVAAASGHGARRLAPCDDCGFFEGGRLSWSPNGRWIAFERYETHWPSLWIVSIDGGRPHALTRCLPPACADSQPAWSPNGHQIAFTRTVRTPGVSGLYTVRRDGSGITRIAGGSGGYADPQWSPDGRRIVFDNGPDSIAVVNSDGSHLHVLLRGARGSGPGFPSWSPSGRKILFFNTPRARPHGGFRAEVWTMNPDGSGKRRLFRSPCCMFAFASPIWSPDGRLIAFSYGVSAASTNGTYVISADGTGLQRVSTNVPFSLSWQRLTKRERK